MFSLLATLAHWKLNPRVWRTWYLESCAAAGGKAPEDIEPFLPWNLSEDCASLGSSRLGRTAPADSLDGRAGNTSTVGCASSSSGLGRHRPTGRQRRPNTTGKRNTQSRCTCGRPSSLLPGGRGTAVEADCRTPACQRSYPALPEMGGVKPFSSRHLKDRC